jgi:hypothetical protein
VLLALAAMVSGGISACDTYDPSFYIDAGSRIEVASPADVAPDRAGDGAVSDGAASPDAGTSTDVAGDAPAVSSDAPVDGSSS